MNLKQPTDKIVIQTNEDLMYDQTNKSTVSKSPDYKGHPITKFNTFKNSTMTATETQSKNDGLQEVMEEDLRLDALGGTSQTQRVKLQLNPMTPTSQFQTEFELDLDDKQNQPIIDSMKEQLASNQLNLLDDRNLHLMIKIFEKERDPQMVENVKQARESQIQYIEFKRRCKLAKQNLFPRSVHQVSDQFPSENSPKLPKKREFGSKKKSIHPVSQLKPLDSLNLNHDLRAQSTVRSGNMTTKNGFFSNDPSALQSARLTQRQPMKTDITIDVEEVNMPDEYDRSESDEQENKSHNLFMDSLYSAHPSEFTKQHLNTTIGSKSFRFDQTPKGATKTRVNARKSSFVEGNSNNMSYGIRKQQNTQVFDMKSIRRDKKTWLGKSRADNLDPITSEPRELSFQQSGKMNELQMKLPSSFQKKIEAVGKRFKTPNMNRTFNGDMATSTELPTINFKRINKLRINNVYQGTGKDLRENLLSMGGASKFYRTKRQNILINKPNTMFESTHLQSSSRVNQIWNPKLTSKSLIRELDTSFCERYDEPGLSSVIMNGISQDIQSVMSPHFDYSYCEELEGTSVKNVKRKFHFNNHIDHINNPNKVLKDKMSDFFLKTGSPTKACHFRDTRLDQASKELERYQVKILRANRQFQSINAYKDEYAAKKIYYAHMKAQYPELPFKQQDIHSFTLEGMKLEITKGLKYAEILGACLKIQRCWRSHWLRYSHWLKLEVKMEAARKIQRCFKNSRWVRTMKTLLKTNRYERASLAKAYIKGYLVRKDLYEKKKDAHLRENFEYMDNIKIKLHTQCQIQIAYAARRYIKRRAAKKAKKLAAAEEAKNKKFGGAGRRTNRAATMKK